MKPHTWVNAIYSFTDLKKQEDLHRKFIFDFISSEWNKLNSDEHKSEMIENSFIQQLMKVSNGGRNYTNDEILDHCGTMLVAVSLRFYLFTKNNLTIFQFFRKFPSLFSLRQIFLTDHLMLSRKNGSNYNNIHFLSLQAADTMSTALNFLILMLAMHENVQSRIVREINENFSEEECRDLINNVDYEKLSVLKYVEMAIKEALRLFSPATGIASTPHFYIFARFL